MNKFLKIENGVAHFDDHIANETACREHLAEFQAALEAFRVEKLWSIFRSLDTVGTVHKRDDGSYFVRTPGQPVIFTTNDAGDCFVEQGEKRVVICLDEPLEVLVGAVKEFLKPERYRTLEDGEILQVGDVVVVRGENSPTDFVGGEAHPVTYRRPLLPNSITISNLSFSNK